MDGRSADAERSAAASGAREECVVALAATTVATPPATMTAATATQRFVNVLRALSASARARPGRVVIELLPSRPLEPVPAPEPGYNTAPGVQQASVRRGKAEAQCLGPFPTTRLTFAPFLSFLPAFGAWARTLPFLRTVEAFFVIAPALQ